MEDFWFIMDILVFTFVIFWFLKKNRQKRREMGLGFLIQCAAYFAGLFLCYILAGYVIEGLCLHIAMANFFSIGVTDPLHALDSIQKIIRWFLECFWTWLFTSIQKKEDGESTGRWQYLGFLFLPVFSIFYVISLLLVGEIYVLRYGYGLIFLNILCVFAMNILILYFFRIIRKNHAAQQERELYKQETEMLYRHYRKLDENYQNSRKVIHDTKNHVQAVTRLYENGEAVRARQYVEDVFHLLNQTGQSWYTENKMLNIILNEKLNQEIMGNLKLKLELEAEPLSHLREIDITTIFANLLDNAIEAMGERDERFLELQVRQIQSFCVIKMANSKRDGKHIQKPGYHQGLGLKNVESIVKHYGGTLHIEETTERFQVNIMIPEGEREGNVYDTKR